MGKSRKVSNDAARSKSPGVSNDAANSKSGEVSNDAAKDSGNKKRKRVSSSSSSTTSSSSSSGSSSSSSSSKRSVERKLRRLKRLEKYVSNAKNTSSWDETVIPPFDPQNKEQSVEKWIERVDEIAKTYGWNGATVVKLVANRLKGMARRWYDTEDQLHTNWGKMKERLIKQFKKPLPFGKLLREATLYETEPGQDLSEYCFNKLNKLRALKIEIPEEYLVDAIISGIRDENIERAARSCRITSTGELYSYLSTLTIPSNTRFNNRKSFSTRPEQSYHNIHRPSTSTDSKVKSISCYNCKGPHFFKFCPKPKIECFKCKKIGHKQYNCPLKVDKSSRKETVNEVSRFNDPNPYIKTVVVCGLKLECLIDTGSTCTILRERVAHLLKLKINSNHNNPILRGFSGNFVSTSGTVMITLRIGEAIGMLNAIVVDDNQISYDCIVGRDFLDLPHIIFYKAGNSVVIRGTKEIKFQNDPLCFEIETGFSKDIVIGNISEDHKIKCRQLLGEFNDRIATSLATLGKTNSARMVIKCITEEPIVYNPYRMSINEKEILNGILKELLENGIIRDSDSPYASPVLLVKKKTGDYRMCVDYRRLNAITIKDKYPLPLIDEQIDRLGGNKYFTALDMASGFYQVPVEEESIPKTAFVVPDSHYEFLRMPFGLTNSPAVFQRLMNNVLGKLKNTIAFPYMDDVIIPSKTVEEGLNNLRLVLEALRDHNLTLKLKKCTFFQTKVDYLGREISADGVRPGQVKIDAVIRMEPPKTVKQVRQFLGLAGYFRKFVKNFSTIVEPISSLTRKDVPWEWTDSQQEAFDIVKRILTRRPVLAIFDPSLPTELHTDASSKGFGAILIQIKDGKQHVVAYYSKQTTVDQKNYHSYELETMAVVFALRHFRVYLLSLQFTVITDCSALRTTLSKKDLIPRVARWWLEIQEYTFEVKYRPGNRMCHVDALSRNPIKEINKVDITEGDWILSAQSQDEQISRIRKILQNEKLRSETRKYFEDYELKNSKLYRKLPDGRKLWVVPRDARWQICCLCHDKNGHPGVELTIQRIKRNYWFPKMRRFVNKYVNACLNCAYYKDTARKRQGKLHPIEKTAIPFHTIHIDHVGPFETSSQGNKFILVIVDGFTKFSVIEPVKSTKTKIVVKVLESITCLFGVPSRIISDRGSAFTSKTFSLFCESYGIKHILNAVATPRGNGQCERYNRTLLNMLSTTGADRDGNQWDTLVKQVQSAMNTSFNKAIKTTPAQALLGYQPSTTAEAPLLSAVQDELERVDITNLRNRIKDFITEDQRKQKERYDSCRKEAKKFKEQDLILVLITSEANTGTSKKLLPKYKGPFKVTRVLFNDRYEVEDLREGSRRSRTVVSSEKMKPWISVCGDD